jgi:hypothetical protein
MPDDFDPSSWNAHSKWVVEALQELKADVKAIKDDVVAHRVKWQILGASVGLLAGGLVTVAARVYSG